MKKVIFRYKKYHFEMYNRPGLWMKKKQLIKIQNRMIAIAKKRLGAKPLFGIYDRLDVFQNKFITFCSKEKNDLCFNAMSYIGHYNSHNVIHMGATCCIAGNKGIMSMTYFWGLLFLRMRHHARKIYVTGITHTPRLLGIMNNLFSDVYPNPFQNGAGPKPYHYDLVELFMNTYRHEWDLVNEPVIDKRFILEGFRRQKDNSILYPDTVRTVPRHRNNAYNKYCYDNLDFARGDEFIMAGEFKFSNIQNVFALMKKR